MRRSQVQDTLWTLIQFDPGNPWFNFPAALVNGQLVCLRPVGILNSCCCCCCCCSVLFCCFVVFHWPWKAPTGGGELIMYCIHYYCCSYFTLLVASAVTYLWVIKLFPTIFIIIIIIIVNWHHHHSWRDSHFKSQFLHFFKEIVNDEGLDKIWIQVVLDAFCSSKLKKEHHQAFVFLQDSFIANISNQLEYINQEYQPLSTLCYPLLECTWLPLWKKKQKKESNEQQKDKEWHIGESKSPFITEARVWFPDWASDVGWVCWFSSVLQQVFSPGEYSQVFPPPQNPTHATSAGENGTAHNIRHFIPYSSQIVCGFFEVPQGTYEHRRYLWD